MIQLRGKTRFSGKTLNKLWACIALILFLFWIRKPTELPNDDLINPSHHLYDESLKSINNLQREIELEIQLQNERRSLDYFKGES